jgi:hypothetical protein
MTTQKITLAIITLIAACTFQACNGSHDKSSMDTQGGQPTSQSQTAGNDSSHTTDNRRNEVGGVAPVPGTAASGNTNANGTTTAQGMTGADSVYQKGTQKSQK